jgi:hypothetical protein
LHSLSAGAVPTPDRPLDSADGVGTARRRRLRKLVCVRAHSPVEDGA